MHAKGRDSACEERPFGVPGPALPRYGISVWEGDRMIGIIVMTHGSFSTGAVDACELVTGPVTQAATLSLRREDNVDDFGVEFQQALDKVDTGEGVLVLCDILGGSPCNVAAMALREREGLQVLTGLNLPMLLEALMTREQVASVEELAKNCLAAANEGVKHVNELLG